MKFSLKEIADKIIEEFELNTLKVTVRAPDEYDHWKSTEYIYGEVSGPASQEVLEISIKGER